MGSGTRQAVFQYLTETILLKVTDYVLIEKL